MHPMNLQRLRHFVELAETLNFRRAAERLHMAQPPLSVSIQKLEAELGTRLFERAPSGVTITPAGLAMLAEAKRVLFHAAQITSMASSAAQGTGGRLQIGFVGSAIYGLLQKLVYPFRTRHPGVELVLREATSIKIVQMLDDGELDIGLVRTPLTLSTKMGLLTLEHDQFVAAIPSGNALGSKPDLCLADLQNEPFIMYSAVEASGFRSAAMLACQQAGFYPQVAQEASQIQTLLALVEIGLGIALVPSVMQRFVSKKIVYRVLTDQSATKVIGMALAFRPGMESPAALRFKELAISELPVENTHLLQRTCYRSENPRPSDAGAKPCGQAGTGPSR